ncbi:MAG: ATP-binding protein [Bacteroidota bacterium]
MEVSELRRWVKQGEGKKLEFKRKANHPDKICRELIAFANSSGGTLLVGVDDNCEVYGTKTPGEDLYALQSYLEQFVKPELPLKWSRIPVTNKREVIQIHVLESKKKPHFLLVPYEETHRKVAFVRVNDMSVKASRTMVSLMFHARKNKAVSVQIGEAEKAILEYLELQPNITLSQAQKLLKTSKRVTSGKLITLVRTGILNIHPTEREDYFQLNEEAFEM